MCCKFSMAAGSLLIFAIGCAPPVADERTPQKLPDPIAQIVGNEELIIALTPSMQRLSASIHNLKLPDQRARPLFADRVVVTDLVPNLASTQVPVPDQTWTCVSKPSIQSREQLNLWKQFLANVAYFENAKFAFVDIQRMSSSNSQFETQVKFRARARLRNGHWADCQARLQLDWERLGEQWLIAGWNLKHLKTLESSQLFFEDKLKSAIPNSRTRRQLEESKHWQYATRHYYPQRRASLPGNHSDDRFFPISTAHHPGIAVVDIDQDGFDDLYLTVRWGKNLLLRNQADGTFEEVAEQYGLDIDGRSNAAIFVDFDNDGDKDLMLARSLERSQYWVNENGRFVERSDPWVAGDLPYEATSVSAADFNNDGLMDVYFATYHQDDVSRRIDADLSNSEHRIHGYLTDAQSAELKRRHQQENRSFINQIGPPNLLLENVGAGRFRPAVTNEQLAVWRNSFQATWSDYDRDGDVDLYVANDFAPDHLFRNEGSNGWSDVSEQSGIDKLGFAMGASWGDYDNDGYPDLYVSNMYSKAGRRITRLVDGLDHRITRLATGNYLYRQTDGRFDLVSGLRLPQLPVARAGWAWGGQFADFNNDGFQDIYVASGYYTAPAEYETNVDL
ncbi:MAG: VCBS repeat-containing protein [Planctomycetaceae bacterium]|nr:VCBS repeat-containing protein [Planctomycetaceae bacterium]